MGEELILQQNAFVERILPGSIIRELSDEEMDAYRAPFPTPESRLPIWRFPNKLPIEGRPLDVWKRLSDAHRALRMSTYPKLLFAADPGALVSVDNAREFAAQSRSRLVLLGAGRHFLQGRPSRNDCEGDRARNQPAGPTVSRGEAHMTAKRSSAPPGRVESRA